MPSLSAQLTRDGWAKYARAQEVRYTDKGVQVVYSDLLSNDDDPVSCTVACDYVLCTVPLGVLKSGDIAFTPPLPLWKQLAVRRLGFGLLNKCIMRFSEVFWHSTEPQIGRTNEALHASIIYCLTIVIPHCCLQAMPHRQRGTTICSITCSPCAGSPCC